MLHHAIRDLLDSRAAEVAGDIDHTIACLRRAEQEVSNTQAALARLRDEEQAIADARQRLGELAEVSHDRAVQLG